jgi:hypothetical protein
MYLSLRIPCQYHEHMSGSRLNSKGYQIPFTHTGGMEKGAKRTRTHGFYGASGS